MATSKKTPAPAKSKYVITNHEVNIRSADRSSKDISTWRDALRTAESVYYPRRVRLYDLYADILLDGHLSGIISKRMDAVLNKDIFFEKGGKRVEDMDALVHSQKFREIMHNILETQLWGISGLEFIPGAELNFLRMHRKHIRPDLGKYVLEQNGEEGYDYRSLSNLWVMGDKDDLGLLLKCSPYALYKRGGMADWAQYVEIFGMPVRVVKYDAHDTQTKVELRKTLDESGSALALMIPNQANFEMHDGKQSNGNGELQQKFTQALNNEMSVIILGNTETTSNDNGGSNAKSQTHQQQQIEVTKSDLKYVANMLNDPQFISILRSYGYPVEGGSFVFEKEVDMAQIKEQVGILQTVKTLGTPVDDDYIYELTGIPKPKDYDKLKKQREEERKAVMQQRAAGPQNVDDDRNWWQKARDFFVQAP